MVTANDMNNEEKKVRCHNCKFWATKDEGYSNYTVEETVVHCLKNKFDAILESYSWRQDPDNEFFKQAESCEHYKYSDNQIELDVDGDVTIEDYNDDPELYEAAKQYEW